MRLYYDHHQEIQNWCLLISVNVCLPFIYVISCLITLIYCFLHMHLFPGLNTYSVYGSFNKDVLINLPKSWFIPCFHFLLPVSEVCRFSSVVIFRLLVPNASVVPIVASYWKLVAVAENRRQSIEIFHYRLLERRFWRRNASQRINLGDPMSDENTACFCLLAIDVRDKSTQNSWKNFRKQKWFSSEGRCHCSDCFGTIFGHVLL